MLFVLVTYLLASTLAVSDSKRPDETPPVSSNAEHSMSTQHEMKSRSQLGLDPEVLQRLSPEQILQLAREREITARERATQVPHVPAVATVSTIGLFTFLALVIIGTLWASALKDRRKQDTLRAIIEKGGQIPPELLRPTRGLYSDLRRGIILIASGVGLTILLVSLRLPRSGVWTAGLIPGLVGVGYMIAWYFEKRERLARGIHGVS
jgi:hypothetical protein